MSKSTTHSTYHCVYLYTYTFLLLTGLLTLISCTNSSTNKEAGTDTLVSTPVTVATGKNGTLQDRIILNATSIFLSNTDIKATINGYIQTVKRSLGDQVDAGQTLFVLETKESRSLGSTITRLDTSFDFSGITTVKSTASGYITLLNHQAGDYVQDGEVLASINNKNSFGFILNLPFEYRQLVSKHQQIIILLPDGTKVSARVSRFMPQMDSISQTQRVFLTTTNGELPAGLMAKVILIKKTSYGFMLPKEGVYADESQDQFWVLKLLDDSIAIKVPIEKGLENGDSVGIVSPRFNREDRFVVQGGYGLSDTANISIQK